MPSSRFVSSLLVLLLGTLAGTACSKGPATPATPNASTPAASSAAPAAPPAAMPAHTTAPPAAPSREAGTEAAPVSAAASGKVLETMDSGGYTYVRLDTGADRIWAATAPMKVKVGQELTVPLEMPIKNFHSSTLNRDFPLIYFASRVSRGGEPLPPAAAAQGADARPAAAPGQVQSTEQAMPPGHPPIGSGANASGIKVTEVIAPPAGGHSVADVWARRAALSGKTVVVRGKVIKFLSGIMGRNWIHLQDGTGDAKAGTNDITVTTDADAKPGEIVTATGSLAIDKDFGAGYKYGAIVESSTLSR